MSVTRLNVIGAIAIFLSGCAFSRLSQTFYHCSETITSTERNVSVNRVLDRRYRPVLITLTWIEKRDVPRSILLGGNAELRTDVELANSNLDILPVPFNPRTYRVALRSGSSTSAAHLFASKAGDSSLSLQWSAILPAARRSESLFIVSLDRRGRVIQATQLDPAVFSRTYHALQMSLDRTAELARDPISKCDPGPLITIGD